MSTLRAVTVLVLGVSFVACAERSEDGPTSPKLQVVGSGADASTPPMSVAEVAPSFAAAARREPSRRRVGVIFSGPSKELGRGDENLLISEGAQIVYRFRSLKAALVSFPAKNSHAEVDRSIDRLRQDSKVTFVGGEALMFPTGDATSWETLSTPNGHGFFDSSVQNHVSSLVIVAVIGTGIDCANTDLTCFDGETFAPDGAPWDEDGSVLSLGHETGVASVIASHINGVGRYGYANGVRLLSVRIFNNGGGGAGCE